MMPIPFTPYQIVVPLCALVLIVYAWNLVMRRKKSVWEGVLWTFFWSAISVVSLFPSSLQYLSTVTGIKRNENAATITAIGVLFFIVFYLIMRIEALEQRVVKVVREKALKDSDVPDAKISS